MPGLRQPVHGVTGSIAGCGVERLSSSPGQSTGGRGPETSSALHHNCHYDVAMSLVKAPGPVLQEKPAQPSAWDVAAAFLLAYSGNTRSAYHRDLTHFFAWCTRHDLDPLAATRGHVDAYARTLAEVEGRSASTVARKLSTLSGYYRYAVDEEIIASNPVTRVRRPRVGSDTQSTGLDRQELASLISAAEGDGPRSLVLVLLLGLNGLRVSEVLGVDASDLDTERGHRVLRVTRKGGRRATVPLAPRTAHALADYLTGRQEGPLLITASAGRMDRAAVWRTLRRLARQAVPAKAASIHPHDLRHAFVTLALDSGASLRDVQDAAGHADPRTTRRYDRARHNLDRHPTYALAALVSS